MKNLGRKVEEIGEYDTILGIDSIQDIIYVDQKSIGANSRSNLEPTRESMI